MSKILQQTLKFRMLWHCHFASKEAKRKKCTVCVVWDHQLEKLRDGWNILAGDKHSPYMSQSPQPRLNSSPSLFSLLTMMWQVGVWQLSSRWFRRDISSSFPEQLLPAESRTNWALHVGRQVNCQPDPNSGSARNFTSVVASSSCHTASAVGQDPALGPSGISQMYLLLYQHKVSKPQRPTL